MNENGGVAVSESVPIQIITLTLCVLVDFSTVIFWTSPFVVLGLSSLLSLLFGFEGKSC